MADLFLGGKFQALNATGVVPGALLYSYLAGTLTPQSTFTNQGGGSANTNPVVCDALGQADVWLGAVSYRMILKTAAGVTIWDEDNLTGTMRVELAATTGAALIGGGDQIVVSIAALRLLLKTSASKNAYLTGSSVAGDGGGGSYYYDAADTTSADNGGTVIVAADGGRWKLANNTFSGMRNRLINGAFTINQLALSGTVTLTAGAYGHDGWKGGAAGCTYTFASVNGLVTLTISAGSLIQVVDAEYVPYGINTMVLGWTGTAQGKIGAGAFAASGVSGSVTGGVNLNVEFNTGTLALAQLERGVATTNFEHRNNELWLCQAQCIVLGGSIGLPLGSGVMITATEVYVYGALPRTMRAAPSSTINYAAAGFTFISNGVSNATLASGGTSVTSPSTYTLDFAGTATAVANGAAVLRTTNASQNIRFEARL